jgi:hypothetical protein
VFGILRRLLPHATGLAYVAGALTLVHASDGALQFIGQLNQLGFIFWMLLAGYAFAVATDGRRWPAATAAMILAAAFQHMSLWSYESGLFIVLLLPVAIVLARWPLPRSGVVLCALWYVVPAVYAAVTVATYYPRPASAYQFRVMRSDWSAAALAGDLAFNVTSSLSFWSWCQNAPVAVPPARAGLLALLAGAVFVGGGLLIARIERGHVPGESPDLGDSPRPWSAPG